MLLIVVRSYEESQGVSLDHSLKPSSSSAMYVLP